MAIERPLPSPDKLLGIWMQWETGESTPGRVMADLKIAGLREFLESIRDAN